MNHAPERHFTASATVRDIVIGMSDGLTVPFALAAGLTGAVAASRLVVTGGLAEVVAGSISMGLGGYLAARSDTEHYERERRIEEHEVKDIPEQEAQEIRRIFSKYGLSAAQTEPIMQGFRNNHSAWINFMMKFELGLNEVTKKRAYTSAATIATSYAIGGLVPLSPYFFISDARHALVPSIIVTLIALFVFGYSKAKVSGTKVWRSAFQTVVIGGVAAAAAFFLARAIV